MTDQPDLRQQLAAFLAGELDEPAATRLQARIDSEPDVARVADQMADMLAQLGQVDSVEPPQGYAERLRLALQEQTGVQLPPAGLDARSVAASGAAAATGWARHAPEGPLSSRPGPVDRFPRLGRVLAVAAGVVVLAVAVVSVFGGQSQMDSRGETTAADAGSATSDDAVVFGGGDEEGDAEFNAAEESMDDVEAAVEAAAAMTEEPAAELEEMTESLEAAPETAMEAERQAGADEQAAEEAEDSVPADADPAAEATEEQIPGEAPPAVPQTPAPATSPPSPESVAGPDADTTLGVSGPVVLDLGRVDDDEAVRTLVGRDPAAQGLLGTDASLASQLATDYQQTLAAADPYSDAIPADRCVADVLQSTPTAAVPAVAARIDQPSGPAIAIALVSSTTGDVLDTVQVVVVDLVDCQPLRTLDVGTE